MSDCLDISPAPVAAVLGLQAALGCSGPLAQVLWRRGLGDPEAARAWLAAADDHDPGRFAGMDAAVTLLRAHVAAGTRITIHGDYDVDGVCSTAILVRTLRALGADVDWFIPSRAEDGYGLRPATVARLAARGTRLLVTVDCGVTSVDEVAQARAAGLDVLVTDHHAPRADGMLPDCAIVHPAVCGYPVPELCAAGVAHKLALALVGATRVGLDPADDLDLVALATVADCVPLVGENRRLVREGLRRLAATRKPGLRALMRVSRVDPGAVDAGTVGFRLAPRINAAGRMHRADAGVELVLTDDEGRAAAIAEELDRLNGDRRHTEQRILFEAEAQVAVAQREAEEHDLPAPSAYVLAGEGWHPGVIGIVASRIAERHHRPALLIALPVPGRPAAPVEAGGPAPGVASPPPPPPLALGAVPADEAPLGTGSGRSIRGFDLLGALDACAHHLVRHGGHRAAAGCTVAPDAVPALRAAFCAHAAAVLTPELLVRRERVDAVVSGDELGLDLAEELGALAPFGMGNPAPALLVPAARLVDARPLGQEGKHLKLTVEAGGRRAAAVAFGTTTLPEGAATGVDVTFGLERNEWQGVVEPRLVLRQTIACDPAPITVVGEPADWVAAVLAELRAPVVAYGRLEVPAIRPGARSRHDGAAAQRRVVDRRGAGVAGVLTALVASGEPVLVLCADTRRRGEHLAGRLGGFDLACWRALERDPGLGLAHPHVVALDPPPHPALRSMLTAGPPDGMAHLAWGAAELGFSDRVHREQHALRDHLAAAYRRLRRAPGEVDTALPRSPVVAGRVLAVLTELGLVELHGSDTLALHVPAPGGRRPLEGSATFRTCATRQEEAERWLSSSAPLAA